MLFLNVHTFFWTTIVQTMAMNAKAPRLNILIIYEGMREHGGVQVHVYTLESELRKLGHNVLMFPVPPLHLETINACVLFYFSEQFVFLLFGIVRIFRLIRRQPVHIVHVHGARLPLVLTFFVSKIMKIPFVVTVHEAWTRANKLNRQYRSADKIIAVSQESEAVLKSYGVDPLRLTVIPNMVTLPPSAIKFSEEGNLNIVFVGRLDPSKTGILKILMDAAPKIMSEFANVRIWIVGSRGQEYASVSLKADQVNALIGKKTVFLLGHVRNPSLILDKAHIVIGVGRVALEAMSHSKPVIVGSSADGVFFRGGLVTRENANFLERSNFTGRNYSDMVNSAQLAELIVGLLRDRSFRSELGRFGREFVAANFASDVIVARTVSVYYDCIRQRRKGSINQAE